MLDNNSSERSLKQILLCILQLKITPAGEGQLLTMCVYSDIFF